MSSVSSESSESSKDAHLFVLIHGLWGGPNHMNTIERNLLKLLPSKSPEKIVTLKPSSFRFWKTYDGLKINSQKVISEIFYEIETLKSNNLKVTKISIVGYSLGGLISRYIIGLLNTIGFFDAVQPVFFTTFATPHVGIEFFGKNTFDAVRNSVGGYLFGKSGRELFLGDSDVALREMADPSKPFHQGLAKFQKLVLLANIRNDRSVSFFTSYITEYSPFDKWDTVKINYLPDLPLAKISKVQVKPHYVDLTTSEFLTKEEVKTFKGNVQDQTSYLRTNPFLRVLVVVGIVVFFLPIWIPFVLTTSIVVSIYSHLKIRLVSFPDTPAHWKRLQNSIYTGHQPVDADDLKEGQNQRDQRRQLETHESFKGDTSHITKNAIDNFMYVDDRIRGRSRPEEDEVHNDEDGDETSSMLTKTTSNIVIDVDANDSQIKNYLEILTIKDASKIPLFQDKVKLDIDKDKRFIIDNLNKLDWVKVPVYLDCWNAHDTIVSRRTPKNAKGTAVIGLWCSILRNHLDEQTT